MDALMLLGAFGLVVVYTGLHVFAENLVTNERNQSFHQS